MTIEKLKKYQNIVLEIKEIEDRIEGYDRLLNDYQENPEMYVDSFIGDERQRFQFKVIAHLIEGQRNQKIKEKEELEAILAAR